MQKIIILTSSQYQLLRPIILICKYCCILPFAIKQNGNDWWIYWTWWSIIAGVIGVVTIGTSALYGVYTNYYVKAVFKIRIYSFSTKLVNGASMSTLIITFLICSVSSNVNFKYLQEYFFHLTKADNFTKFVPSVRKAKTYTKILYGTIFIKMLIYSIDLAVWSKIAYPESSIIGYSINQLPFYLLFLIMELATIYYHFLVKCIDDRLSYLNTRLREKYCYYKNPVKCAADNISKYGLLQKDITSDKRSEAVDKTKINYLKGYECLVEASTALNNYFGAKLLILLFGAFFYLLITPYDLYTAMLHRQHLFILLQVLWMAGHLWRLLILIEPCNAIAQEVQKMSLIVCKILNIKTDMEPNEKLQLLLSVLDHCPIKFTSCNIIAMDRKLLISIAGGVTTYLVILFQFGG
uniref:Gustatory receptor n=1 Tax=Diabrotica virgifera virgifera TaxID=50390 RepID=A0A6P7GST6_DIAVI